MTSTVAAAAEQAVPNLTRERAAARADLLAVHTYAVTLDLSGATDPRRTSFHSTSHVRFAATDGASTWIELHADRVLRVQLNGRDLPVERLDGLGGIAIDGLAEENELIVEAEGSYSRSGAGLHRFFDPADGQTYLYTQFEPADAQRVFACFDQPDLKARFTLTVRVPRGWTVLGNTPVARRTPEADREVDHWILEPTPPLPTYLVGLVAGPYTVVERTYRDEWATVPLRLACRASLAHHLDAEALFRETGQGLAFFHRLFDVPFPFAKYDQCFVPEFNGSAMENAACVTVSDRYVFRERVTDYDHERRAETLLHELSHMWFGDLVTMRWWEDLWLNESFATWAGLLCLAEATDYANAWSMFATYERAWAQWQDGLPTAHPIAADTADLRGAEVNFDGITYAKGASVLKQLVAWVGRENFRTGLRAYFTEHAWGNATIDDLLRALSNASGRDLADWRAHWLDSAGRTELRPEIAVDDSGLVSDLVVRHRAVDAGARALRPHRIAVGLYTDDPRDGRLVRTRQATVDVRGDLATVPALRGAARPELTLVDDGDQTYASVRFDPRSLDVLRTRLADIADPLARACCWSAAWEMVRDAELPAGDYVAMVMAGAEREDQISVLARLLHNAGTALSLYSDPSRELTRWGLLSDTLADLAAAAPPGSDRQLVLARSLAGSVLDARHVRILRGWFDGTAVPDGLVIGPELRWRLLHGLIAHEAADAREIDELLRHDHTAAGERGAVTARALLPDLEAKQGVWRTLERDRSLSNEVREALAAGFWHPTQNALCRPLTGTFLTAIDGMWAGRSSESEQLVIQALAPVALADDEVLAAVDRWLSGQHEQGLRRIVVELRSDLRRVLAARAFDEDRYRLVQQSCREENDR